MFFLDTLWNGMELKPYYICDKFRKCDSSDKIVINTT